MNNENENSIMTLREFKERYKNGEFNFPDFNTQVKAGWYDYFCDHSELPDRLKKIWKILEGVTADYILDNYYVWFKNNCPAVGPLYDDVRFEPIDQSKREDDYFLIEIDNKNGYCKYDMYSPFIDGGYECSFDTADAVSDYINEVKGGIVDENIGSHYIRFTEDPRTFTKGVTA